MSRPTTNPASHKPSPTPSINDHLQRQLNSAMYQSHDQMFIQSGRKPSLLSGNTDSRYNSQGQSAAAAAIASALANQNQSQVYNSSDVAKAAAIAATNSYLSQYRGNTRRPGPPQESPSPLNFNPSAIATVISSLSSIGINPNHPHYTQIIQQHLQQFVSKTDTLKREQPSTPQPVAPVVAHSSSGPPQMLAKNTGQNQANCYVPQVEAISPTPEDQKENSNLQEFKQKLMNDIERVDKDIASTQYQFDLLKKKQMEIEHEKFNQNHADDLAIKNLTLAEKIYVENKKKAEESHRQILKPLNSNSTKETVNSSPKTDESFDECIPFYHEFYDTKISQDIRAHFDSVMKKRLLKYFKRQQLYNKQRKKYLIEKYDDMHIEWQNGLNKSECAQKKRQKEAKSREFYEKVFPELRKQREERERSVHKHQRTQPEMDMLLVETHQLTEEERKRMLALSVVPPVIYDEIQCKYSFVNENGFVSDPVALFKQCRNEVFWNEKEKETFLEKMLIYGKNFDAIASFLDKKTVGDCIEYYYLTKKKVNYKLLIRKNQRRRKKDIKSNANNNNNNGGNSSSSTTNTANPSIQTNNSLNTNTNSSSSNSNTTNSNNQTNLNQLNVNTICNNATMDQVELAIDTQKKNSESNNGNQMMTNDQSTNPNGGEDRPKKDINDQSQNGEKRNEPLKNDNGENENGDEANEDDEDDEDDDKSNSTKNSKNFSQSDNSCISCKKLKNAKKKPRSTKSSRRIGLRSVPKKYFSLSTSKQATVRLEFNLDIPETKEPSEAPRIRLCLDCFKKLLNRLNELLTEELKSRQEEPKQAENVTAVSDDEYHDYDDDDEPVSESSEDPQENRITSTTSPNKTKIETVSPTEQITISQNQFDSSFQAIENSKEKSKIMKTDHDDNNNTVDPKAPVKQISEVINDAIKTALQVNVVEKPKSPIESPVSSTSSQNSSFFGSITKGMPVQPETKPNDVKPPTIDKKEIMINKQNDTPEVANGYSVLNDLISQQLHTNLSKMNTSQQPSPPAAAVPAQSEEAELDNEKKYTLGRWVDTIIVKMNDKPVDEIDMQKFKDQLPMSSNENSAAANLLKAKKGQSDESSCSSVASSPGNKTKQEILIDSDGEESNTKMDQQADEKKESQSKIKNRIESIIESELANMNEDQTPRGRTSSLTMKLLQENLTSPKPTQSPNQTQAQSRPSPSPKRQSPSEKSENWIGSMLGGVIMKSLNEDLPPPVNIPPIDQNRSPHHIKQRPVSPAKSIQKPTKDLNLIAQARSYGQPVSNQPPQNIPSSPSPSGKKGFTPVPQKIPPAQPVPHRPIGQQYMNYPMNSPGPSRSASANISPSSMPQNSVAMFIQKELHDLDQQGFANQRSRQYQQRQSNQQMLSPSPPPQQQQQPNSNQNNSTNSPSSQNSGLTASQIATIIQAATSAASNSTNSAAAAAAAAAAAVACMNSNMFQSGSSNGTETLIQSILSAANMMNQYQHNSESQSGKKMSHSSQSALHLMGDSHGYPAPPSHHIPPHLSQHDHHVRSGLKSPQMHPGQMMHHSPEIIIQESGSNNRHHMQPHHSPSKSGSYNQPPVMMPFQHQMPHQMPHHEQQSFKKRLLSTSMEQSMAKSQQFSRPSITGSHMIPSMPPPSGAAFHQHGAYPPPSSHHSQHLPPNYPKMLKSNQHSTMGPIMNSYHNQYEYMSDTEN